MTEPRLLAFDTSGPSCMAALLIGDQVSTRIEDMDRGQAERLIPLLEEMLAEAALTWADLDGIGVGVGPGNFTGIRISVSAARGLALGLQKPAIGVNNFDVAAFGLRNVVACLPAPRNQAYVKAFVDLADPAPKLVDLEKKTEFPSIPSRAEARFVGPAAKEVARAYLGPNANDNDIARQPVPPIEAIARIASLRLASEQDPPAPMYVKPPDAAPAREQPPLILP